MPFERLKRREAADADLRALMENPQTTAAVRQQATERVAQGEFNLAIADAQRLVREGRFADAVRHVQEKQATPTGRTVAASYQKLLRWVQDAEKRAAGAP